MGSSVKEQQQRLHPWLNWRLVETVASSGSVTTLLNLMAFSTVAQGKDNWRPLGGFGGEAYCVGPCFQFLKTWGF